MARRRERSAGLLAFRRGDELEVLLAHPGGPLWAKRDEKAWTIPKGLADAEDDLLATAKREFTEETGFTAQGPFIALQPVKQKSGKVVHAWAFESNFDASRFVSNFFEMEWPPRTGRLSRFPEIDRLEWFSLSAAVKKILPYQESFLEELKTMITPK
jgi:predicted NUDIX family NTP pyrophosphohydrolase